MPGFLIITGRYLFPADYLVGSDEVTRDINLIQFSEILGPLTETMFIAWARGASYFADDDKKTRLSETLNLDGKYGTWDFMRLDCNDAEGQGGDEGEEEEDAASEISEESWSESSTTAETPLIIMAHCQTLEKRFTEKKPEDIDEAEEKQIVHLLRWIFQYDAAMRPTVQQILDHPWFRDLEEVR